LPYLGSQTLVFVWEMLFKKFTTFSALSPIQKIHQGVARGMCPLLFGGGLEVGAESPSSPRKFWTCERLKMTPGRS
jgi:hypothetical protein